MFGLFDRMAHTRTHKIYKTMANNIEAAYLHKNLFHVHKVWIGEVRERRSRIAAHIRKIIIIFIYTQSNLTCNDNIRCSFSIPLTLSLSLYLSVCVGRFALNFVPYRTRVCDGVQCTMYMLDTFFVMPLAFDLQDDFDCRVDSRLSYMWRWRRFSVHILFIVFNIRFNSESTYVWPRFIAFVLCICVCISLWTSRRPLVVCLCVYALDDD